MTAMPPKTPSRPRLLSCQRRSVEFRRGSSAEFPFLAEVDGERWVVRVNYFAERALCTLLLEDHEAGDLEAWPAGWRKPD